MPVWRCIELIQESIACNILTMAIVSFKLAGGLWALLLLPFCLNGSAKQRASGRRSWATYSLALFTGIIFFIEWVLGASPGHYVLGGTSSVEILDRMGSLQPHLWQTRQYHRLLTANFLHRGYSHFFMNMLALLVIGTTLERWVGRTIFVMIYILGGVGATVILSILEQEKLLQFESVVGASSAIMAVAGAIVFILFCQRRNMPTHTLAAVLFIMVIQFLSDFFGISVSNIGHLSGFGCGLIVASVARYFQKRKPA